MVASLMPTSPWPSSFPGRRASVMNDREAYTLHQAQRPIQRRHRHRCEELHAPQAHVEKRCLVSGKSAAARAAAAARRASSSSSLLVVAGAGRGFPERR